MGQINVTVVYNPTAASGSQWSLTGDNVSGTTIEVNDRGANPINWGIQLATGASGSIAFNSSNGIAFKTAVTPPTQGTTSSWNWTLTNNLQPNSTSLNFEYVVNALYTPQNGTQQNVQWDPDVEENPPAQIVLKAKA